MLIYMDKGTRCLQLMGELCVLSQSCPTLWDPMDYSPHGSSVWGIFQARILEQVGIPFSRGAFQPRDWTCVSCISYIGRWTLYHWTTREASNFMFHSSLFLQLQVEYYMKMHVWMKYTHTYTKCRGLQSFELNFWT